MTAEGITDRQRALIKAHCRDMYVLRVSEHAYITDAGRLHSRYFWGHVDLCGIRKLGDSGCGHDHKTHLEALRCANEMREMRTLAMYPLMEQRWLEGWRPQLFIRVDGELGDEPQPGERSDPPSMTVWQRDVDEEAMR